MVDDTPIEPTEVLSPAPEAPVEPPAAQQAEQTAQIPVSEPIPEPTPQPSAPVSVVAPIANLTRDLAIKARAVIQGRKRKKLDKILTLIDNKKNIGNDDVEKLLHVSDATATRYLAQLEKEGKVIQVGKTGKSVRYVRS